MKRIKLKNKLQSIVSVFLIVSILGASVAIFAGTRVDETETNHITDVGYILGTSRGTGSLVASYLCKTFAESEKSELYYRGYVDAMSRNYTQNFVQILKGQNSKTDDGKDYAIIESVENGDSYLKIHRGSTSSQTIQAFFPADATGRISAKAKKVIVEFDFKIDEGFEFNRDTANNDPLLCEMSFVGSMQDPSSYQYLDFKRYTHGGIYESKVDGYYTYSYASYDCDSLNNYLMKYGEWYNFRFEFEYDNNSTRYTLTTYVNDILVKNVTSNYHSTEVNSTAFAFMVFPRMYAHNLDISIDNYCQKRLIR